MKGSPTKAKMPYLHVHKPNLLLDDDCCDTGCGISISRNWKVFFCIPTKPRQQFFFELQRIVALHGFWDFEKTALHKIRVSGTVGVPYKSKNAPLACI